MAGVEGRTAVASAALRRLRGVQATIYHFDLVQRLVAVPELVTIVVETIEDAGAANDH
jgi:hypothetical protein